MVAAIRFWLRAFGLSIGDELTSIAHYLFNSENGKDPFTEDINTQWLLHFLLVQSGIASIYNLLFVEMQRERKEFTKTDLQQFIKRACDTPEQKNVYNENTIRKDIGVLLKNYAAPSDIQNIDDFNGLLLQLNLIETRHNGAYSFREVKAEEVSTHVILFAIKTMAGNDKTISLDKLQSLSLIFCMPIDRMIETIQRLVNLYPDKIVFSNTSGVRNVQLLKDFSAIDILNDYYDHL